MNNVSPQFSYRLEPFFELSPDLLCIAGYDGYFKRINPAVSKLLGYSMEELYSRPINDFVFEDDKIETAQKREQLTKSNPLYYFENRYVTKSGEIVWLSWTSLPADDIQLIYAVAKNITHKKKLEEERNSLLANLTTINKDLKQITYTTSHDLRTPVNNLLAVFSLIDSSKITDPDTLDFIGVLQKSTESLKDTLNNYVDILSQKESLNEQLELVNFDASLNSVKNSLKSLIETSKTEFEIDFSELEHVHFNRVYMESIFMNLISNSIKYSKKECNPIIKIKSGIETGKLRLIFSDNCLGFDMNLVKDKIFGLHQKFSNHSDSKGIGLYLVHSHITSLGGKITVDSKVNEGTTFTITFRS
ncbi:MAG: PAS domain-containing sensor histidine kinase [Daejeonella sp.]